jgi:hypothetical protein
MIIMLEAVYKSECVQTVYDKSKYLIVFSAVGIIGIHIGTAALNHIMIFSTRHRVKSLIMDLSKMTGILTVKSDYLEKNFFPQMIRSGLTHAAIVLSNDIFTRFAAERLQKVISGVEIRIYDDPIKGTSWIESAY